MCNALVRMVPFFLPLAPPLPPRFHSLSNFALTRESEEREREREEGRDDNSCNTPHTPQNMCRQEGKRPTDRKTPTQAIHRHVSGKQKRDMSISRFRSSWRLPRVDWNYRLFSLFAPCFCFSFSPSPSLLRSRVLLRGGIDNGTKYC